MGTEIRLLFGKHMIHNTIGDCRYPNALYESLTRSIYSERSKEQST